MVEHLLAVNSQGNVEIFQKIAGKFGSGIVAIFVMHRINLVKRNPVNHLVDQFFMPGKLRHHGGDIVIIKYSTFYIFTHFCRSIC